jgi:hypothetical protein
MTSHHLNPEKSTHITKRFIDHFEGITQESLVARAEKELRVLGALIIGYVTYQGNDTIDTQPSIKRLLLYCTSLT